MRRIPERTSTIPRRLWAWSGAEETVMLALAAANGGCWLALYRWYGLLEHRDDTHFAFEKVPGWFDSPQMRQTTLVLLAISLIYLAGFWLVRSATALTPRLKLTTALLIAAPVVANVLLYPVGALDVFNYMVELKLTYHYDQNPYLVTFFDYRADSFALPAFLVDIPLFYGPAWLLFSWIPVAVAGVDDVVRLLVVLKLFNALLLAVTAWLIGTYQRDSRRGWIAAGLFLANPLVLFEGVGNAHNDVMMTCLLVAAMLALQRRSPLAGPLLALSALVKFYTLALLPLFVVAVLAARWGWRRIAVAGALTAATVLLVCLPFWGGGEMVQGLRTGLERSQAYDHVSIYSLAQQYEQERVAERSRDPDVIRERPSAEILPDATRTALRTGFAAAFAGLAGLLAWRVRRGQPMEMAAASTLLLFLLLLTNLYPWYLIPVFAVITLRLDRAGLAYLFTATALGLLYYPMYIYGHFTTIWTRFQTHLFLALFLTLPMVLLLAVRLGGIGSRPRVVHVRMPARLRRAA